MPGQESSQERSAWSARSYEGSEHPEKPTAARRSWPRWSSMVIRSPGLPAFGIEFSPNAIRLGCRGRAKDHYRRHDTGQQTRKCEERHEPDEMTYAIVLILAIKRLAQTGQMVWDEPHGATPVVCLEIGIPSRPRGEIRTCQVSSSDSR